MEIPKMSSYNFSHGHIESGQHGRHKRRNNNRYLHEHAAGELTSQQKWLSISALAGHADERQSSRKNFARLRKGYASMRKSFRALGGAEHGQEEADETYSSAAGTSSPPATSTTSLINQLGSNAARLLRRGVTQVRLNKLYADNNDAIQCTDGSFKIISPNPQSHYDHVAAPIYANVGAQSEQTSSSSRLKSEAEREVDMRLRRSKRRVLPSARYKPPNSERACEGLDLEELEEIKRDNLRLTLRSQKAGLGGALAKHQAETFTPAGCDKRKEFSGDTTHKNTVEPHSELDAIVCSCKHFEGKDNDGEQNGRYEEIGDSKHYYCSCASISSFSCQSEETTDNSRVQEGTPAEQDLDLATSDKFCNDDDAHETHGEFVNLLTEGRKALSQPNLSSYFAYDSSVVDKEKEFVDLQHQAGADEERNKSNCTKGVADEGKTIECASVACGMAREQERKKVEVMRLKGEQEEEEEETTRYAHVSSITLNVIELEKLCGDLVKSCAQHQQEQLSDVVGQRDGDDYHNEKCPADDEDSQHEQRQQQQQQQQEVTTCCKKELLVRFTNSNERSGGRRRTARVAREQAGEAEHKYQVVVADLNDNASALRSSCQQQVGGVSCPGAATRADHHRRLAEQQQQQQQKRPDRAPLAASCTANNQSDRDLHGTQRTADFGRLSSDTTCGGFAADLTSGHLTGQPAPADKDQKVQLICELNKSEDSFRRLANKYQASNEPPIQHQANLPSRTNPIYQTLQESGHGHRDSERRRRQQQRRQEIMLSLTGQPEHLWHELVAEGARINERAVDTTKVFNPATYAGQQPILPPQASANENIYSSLYEDLAQGQYGAINADIDYETTCRNYQNLQDKERRLFEEQINHLRKIKENSCCDARESQRANHAHQQKPPKRSLLSKLKNLLTPGAAAANAASAAEGERDTFAHHKAGMGWMTSSQNVFLAAAAAAGQQQARWDDLTKSTSHLNGSKSSRTLGSMSTQNLFNSSMRYLSASRKSINLAGGSTSSKDGSPVAGEVDGSLFSSKSFISGFLTIGRRSGGAAAAAAARTAAKSKKVSCQKKLEYESLSQLFKNNRQHQQNQQQCDGIHRLYGSFDSLPSADSGLSCGHLQITSSCDENNYATMQGGGVGGGNIYSCTPAETLERVEQQFLYGDDDDDGESDCDNGRAASVAGRLPPAAAMVAVGRARARVDCNPCAYDKEALVFKKGDIIDILERHQSGTWIGRCNEQVGHFKFINVAEIKDDGSQQKVGQADAQSSVTIPSDDGVTRGSPPVQSRPYVTKLEIKNGDQRQPTNVADSELKTRRRSLSSTSSSSLAPGVHKDQVQEERQLETSASRLASSSETLMGSLEQLLASIGLDNCRQVCGPENDRSSSCDNLTSVAATQLPVATTNDHNDDQNRSNDTDGNLSYLAILKRGGINSLDSFSAIERSSDLERIGIIDDEHQRRLLMAAKIIRQALRAAKLDLQQQQQQGADNQQPPVSKSKPITAMSGGNDSGGARQQPPPLPPPLAQLPTNRNGDKTARLRRERNQPAAAAALASTKTMGANNYSGDGREPVYVNLLSTNKIAKTGQSAAVGRNESARASSELVSTTSNKSIPKQNTKTARQNLTTFGTNFLFNDLSQVETFELDGGSGKAFQLDYDHYHDHNECQPMTITNQRCPASCERNNISAQQERTDDTSQRSVQQPHLVNRDCTTAAAVLPKRGVNNLPDLINREKETDGYQMRELPVVAADRNNNQQADHKGDEPIPSPRPPPPPPPPFTRGCSVRVSSRKPKRTSSRLTSREPRRGSQDCSRICLPSNSVGGNSNKLRNLPPAHCSIRSLRDRGSNSDLKQVNSMNLQPSQLASNCTFDHQLLNPETHAYVIERNRGYQRTPPSVSRRAPMRTTTTHRTHDSYHHLLNPQSQIINSKSAYDLRVNFSKFLEN